MCKEKRIVCTLKISGNGICLLIKSAFIEILVLQNRVFQGFSVGQGVNGKGFNFTLAMVKMCSPWPLLNKYTLSKIFEVGLQIPPLPQPSYMAYGKGQKLKIWILFLPWSKCIQSNLKGIIVPFKQKLNVI